MMYRWMMVLTCLCMVSMSGAEIPRSAPELTALLLNGKQVSLDHYKGKVVIVEVFSTTCPHCQKAATTIQKLYKELAPKGFQPLGVAVDRDAPQLLGNYIRVLGLTFPVGRTTNIDMVLDFLQQSRTELFLVPQLVLIDKTGTIRAQYGGGDSADFFKNEEQILRTAITELLAK